MVGTMLYTSGKQFYADHCTHCTCTNSSVSCTKETCPVLECPREYQTHGRCCPQCPIIEESKTSCIYNGKVREAGWRIMEA
ncbi:cysteine-rich motor neuron 1 protein-like [Odontomachus brunneus]|uniref:cysteine-rich motor neuron 1 protein-like n=1 Tax=Odontomachus brunneus TaxID=486640 RepID=UPI0013F29C9E|nr:cysteine-rich motor neuron 1 protein-like [Odontomachus brunneus]